MHSYFMHLNRNCKQHTLVLCIVNVHFMNINSDITVYTLTEIFRSIFLAGQSFCYFSCFHLFFICYNCQSLSQKLELTTNNHAEYLRHHYYVKNGKQRRKLNYLQRINLAKVAQPNKVKSKGHNFIRMYPSPYTITAHVRKYIIL